ncbi:TetR/AcrR family transcriptional regulator [Ciceribacter sp. L1K23]|uniref:TetR/AcrR family transcriptional regulator n=1 Tax=Ciceribacter sp. L1K23 TaxID=2820276 RepID=UPI001B81235D|nr:TetR/AcrR family transcriptional regulator [Ciceribacter sp. L1K23]MBR0556535.1 TetR/AcrR family transcriptional regulator [Ciceribacter sp. L1K23]
MGRPREFDVDKALDAVTCVFWRKGYEGASYADLTEATGVERPALYSAFGNKEAMFRRALDHYYERYLDFIPQAHAQKTSREVASYILHSAIDLHTRFQTHPGCLGINGLLAGSDEAEPVRQALIDARAVGEEELRQRFERAKAEGDLPDNADPEALAAFLLAMVHGLAVQAKAGFSREKLQAVAEQALATWPGGGAG